MHLESALELLAENPWAPLDVAEVALLVARDEYPHLDIEAELAELAGLAREVRPRLRGGLTARVEVLCRYLFHELGFEGNRRNYYDPRNSYLNEVLARRTGLPITLAVVAMAVGSRAGMEVAGVGLPGHFIARVEERGQAVFFDPFNAGRLLSVAECEALVEQVLSVPFQATPEALAAVSVGYVIQRMLTNLKGVYLKVGDHARAARVIGRLLRLCPADHQQKRDLGTALFQAGRAGQAIDHLTAYLAAQPPPEDSLAVRELLRQAQASVARWN